MGEQIVTAIVVILAAAYLIRTLTLHFRGKGCSCGTSCGAERPPSSPGVSLTVQGRSTSRDP